MKDKISGKVKKSTEKLGRIVNEELIPTIEKSLEGMGTIDMAFTMNYVRQLKDLIDEFEKPLNKLYDKIRQGALPDQMDEEGIGTIKIKGLGTLYITSDMSISVVSGQQEASVAWLKENGLGDIIKPVVNASTLKATLKAEMGKGTEIPSDIYNVNPFSRAVIKKN